MGKFHVPRRGSLQFWPRKRAAKILPSVNWKAFSSKKFESKNGLLGFIGYKVGMASAVAKDTTANSMTKGKNIVIPVTIIECPSLKIFSVRFYRDGKVATEVLSQNIDKEMKRKVRMPTQFKSLDEFSGKLNEYEDIRLIVYSSARKAKLKKTPEIIELALTGDINQKFAAAKSMIDRDINVNDVFGKGQMLDIHAVTKGKGLQGPVKRFGITFKQHKSEKGVRRPGSLGPWHPARVTFRTPMAGQLGFFTRVQYNNKVLEIGKEISELKGSKARTEWQNYGFVNSPYCVVLGSVSGAQKRPVVLTAAIRPKKITTKQAFEVMEII
ncbi:MAG: 50S ribosomal protein L3 [Nanoarchaeota archaeon]|nr:50S ribosomal protein L3 [Nanoarchaeota archaeon]